MWAFGSTLFCLLQMLASFASCNINELLLPQELKSKDLESSLQLILAKINTEKHFDDILIYGLTPECSYGQLLQKLNTTPVTLGTTLDRMQRTSLLVLTCNASADNESNKQLSRTLQNTPRLVLTSQIDKGAICTHYFAKEHYNVAIIDETSFPSTLSYYSCRKYTTNEQNYELHYIDSKAPIYGQQFADMQGTAILIDADQLAPHTMLYRNPHNGRLQLTGYIGLLVSTFAEKYNATLKFRREPVIGHVTFYEELTNATHNNLLDIAAAMAMVIKNKDFEGLSYPYLFSSYCLMIPLPTYVPYNELYIRIMDVRIFLIILLLMCTFALLFIYSEKRSWRSLRLQQVLFNDKIFRGLLGQSFPLANNPSFEIKFICFLIFFTSLMTCTMYEAYLQSLFTHPPRQPMINTLDDLDAAGLRILITERDAANILSTVNRTTKSVVPGRIRLLEDFNEFVKIRSSLDTRYAYPVTKLRWQVYKEQQHYFNEPMFYYSDQICLKEFLMVSIPVRPRLPYRDLFDHHIRRVWDSGLLTHWMAWSFYDMVNLKLASRKDLSIELYRFYTIAINMTDLHWVLCIYAASLCCCCLCYLWEWLHWTCMNKTKMSKILNWKRKPMKRHALQT